MSQAPRALRALLRLYPADHRRAYRGEMEAVLDHRWRRTGPGVLARTRTAGVLAADLAWSAALVWTARGRDAGGALVAGSALDLRFVLRALRRTPGYAFTAVVVLAAAVAANATVLSFVRGTLLHTPPWEDPDRVVVVWGSNTVNGQLRDVLAGPMVVDLAREARSVRPLAAFHVDGAYLTVDGRPEVVEALEISVDFLDVLGVTPVLGRDFDERDRRSGTPAAVLVSYGFWRDRLGGDPGAVGRALVVEGSPRTILGVLPEGFQFVAPAPLYTPLRDDILAADARSRIHYNAIGRLAPGATAGEATRELSALMARIEAEHGRDPGWSVLVEPLHATTVSAVRPVLWTLAATVGLVLLLALVNLGTLFRIRTVARADELALRRALGSGRGRIGRVLALETGVLAGAGALAGLAAAPFLLQRVTAVLPGWVAIPGSAVRLPVLRALLDVGVVGFAAGTAVAGALLLTLPGFLAAARRGAVPRLARTHGGLGGVRLLVGLEVALATVLCLGAGLTARSAAGLLATDVGLEDDGLLALWAGDVWGLDAAGMVAWTDAVVEAVEAVPGVRSAAVIDYVDFEAEDDFTGLDILDRALEPTLAVREEWRRVGEGLFETAGMRMLAGRSFHGGDFEGPPRTAVVNRAFARKHFPDGEAVGRFLLSHDDGYGTLEIVGVVADVRSLGPATPAPPTLYVPHTGSPRGTTGVYVRVEGDPMAYAAAVRDAVWSVDPSQPIAGVMPMSERVGAWVAIPRATRALLGGLAALAVLLAAVGVFGVVAYAVRTRRGELGVRLALGASPGRLERDVVGAVAPLVAAGVVAGIVAGVVAAGAARAVLHEVSPADPWSVAGALAAMAAAGLLATWLPARRVGRIDPAEAMRPEG